MRSSSSPAAPGIELRLRLVSEAPNRYDKLTMVRLGSTDGQSAPQVRVADDEHGSPSRRRHRRVDSVGRCFAQLGSGWEASVLNLSVGGLLMRLKRELTPGSTYVVKLLLDEQVAIVEGRVVRTSEANDDRECYVALQFTSVPTEDAARLRRFVTV